MQSKQHRQIFSLAAAIVLYIYILIIYSFKGTYTSKSEVEKRPSFSVKCSCEARDAGRWTRGFRRGGLTRGRGPGYTCHTILCKREYNSKENHSQLSQLWRSPFLAQVLASSFLDSSPFPMIT